MSGNGKQQVFPYPGIETTADGTTAVVWVATHITDGACAYPITSSSAMGAGYQVEVANGKKNLWGRPLFFLEPESEHSSASAAEGFAAAGGRVANFTSGQGLVLMKEVLYTIAGKRLPAVFHIGARALTSHSLNVHAGHDDVMAVSDTGWGILFAKNAQATCDLALIARRAAENSDTPFLNCQDGFLTTHTVESVRLPEAELMSLFVGDSRDKLVNLMDPHNPMMSGVVQNQDSYMKGKIAQRAYYDKVDAALVEAMDEFFQLTGRRYNLIESYQMDDAEYAIVGMGSMIETCEATVDYLRESEGLKVGAIHVTAFRPFPGPQLVEALQNVKACAVVERMDNPMAQSNPLTVELKSAFTDALTSAESYPKIDRIPAIYSGSAGLGSRDVRAGDFVAAYQHMARGETRRYFVLGIRHPLGISSEYDPDVRPKGAFSMRGHSVGGYGSVTTNKIIATISGDLFGMDAQAYPKYGSEKKGLPTTYYLTLADDRIRMHSELNVVDFVPVNNESAFLTGENPLAGLCDGGTVFIQSTQTTPEEVWARVPAYGKRMIRQKKTRVLALDAARIAREVATDPDLEVRMQGIVLLGIFLKATPYIQEKGLSREDVMTGVEKSLRKYFGHRGEQVIKDNLACVRRGYDEVFEIPPQVIAQNLEVEMPENLFQRAVTLYG